MTVYLDVVLFYNFLFNAQILLLLIKLRSGRINFFRLIAAALAGGGLSLAVFIPYLQPYLSAVLSLFLPFLMSSICFKSSGVSEVLWGGVHIFLLSFLLSGFLNFFKSGALKGAVLSMVFVTLLMPFLKKPRKRYRDAEIFYHGKSVAVRGFCDSGNLLRYKEVPVVLAGSEVFEELFGKGFDIKSPNEWGFSEDFVCIPYSSLGKSGVIFGVYVDCIRVDNKCFNEVILGYSWDSLSERVILSSSMV